MKRYQNVRWFDVAMNDPFLVRVLDSRTDLQDEIQPLTHRQTPLVAKLSNGQALNQLHDEVRPSGVGRAAIKNPGDIGMIHQRQGLSLGLESRDDLARVHA